MVAAARASGAVLRTWGDGYGYALVATGRIDAMCDPVVARWDVAPMPVILAEAGGRFTDLDGDTGTAGGSGLATNGLLHDEWLARFAGLPRLKRTEPPAPGPAGPPRRVPPAAGAGTVRTMIVAASTSARHRR